MKQSGWGKYPSVDADVINPSTNDQVTSLLSSNRGQTMIARGMGRSYGDSALADHTVCTRYLDEFAHFDATTGELTCAAGVSVAEVLRVFVPQGWFLPVVPGTKFVSLGGAIASDIHGKGHVADGCFSQHVCSLKLATMTQGIVTCSPNHNTDLFRATCGGMGLTGIILEATLRLRQIDSSYIRQETLRTENLAETMELLESTKDAAYSAAWIDCLSGGTAMGRSIILLGEHEQSGDLNLDSRPKLSVPFDMPPFVLNRYTISMFNAVYYHKSRQEKSQNSVHYETFFFPLDSVLNWNRIYGKNGFTQYQFVLPKAAGLEAMSEILQRIARSQRGSFLSVLKSFGPSNTNFLSFPIEGYTLSLDFKISRGLFEFLDELDHIVADYGGRIYLSKDARVSEQTFKRMYPDWENVSNIRAQYGAEKVFHSLQSQRLGII